MPSRPLLLLELRKCAWNQVGTRIMLHHRLVRATVVKNLCGIWAACLRWTCCKRRQATETLRERKRKKESSQVWDASSAKRRKWGEIQIWRARAEIIWSFHRSREWKIPCPTVRAASWADCPWATSTPTTIRWASAAKLISQGLKWSMDGKRKSESTNFPSIKSIENQSNPYITPQIKTIIN